MKYSVYRKEANPERQHAGLPGALCTCMWDAHCSAGTGLPLEDENLQKLDRGDGCTTQ